MDVFDLYATISIKLDEYEKGLAQAKTKAESFAKGLSNLSSDISKAYSGLGDLFSPLISGFQAVEGVGKTAGNTIMTGLQGFAAASTAVAGFGTAAVKSGMDFDSAMSQVSATLGITVQDIENNTDGAGDTFEMLRNKALEMGSATKFTSKEAAEGLNILAMSGYDATSAVDMIEDVLHLAAAGSMDMANAAGYVSGAMKGFNDETKDSAYYADLMAKGATLANTDVAALGEALSGGAATAKSYSQSAETTTLALLRLAEQGETGSAAATALAAAMKNLYAPTDKATKAMAALGVSAFDPTSGAARDFNDVVNDLSAAMSDLTDQERTQYGQLIFGIQGFDAYNKMVVTSTEKQEAWADALAKSSGEAARQYETMTDNLLGDIDKLGSAFEGLQIVISDALTPTVREFAQFGAEAMNALREGFQGGGVSGFMSALSGIVTDGVKMLAEKAPEFASVSLQFIQALAYGLIDAAPEILSSAGSVVEILIGGIFDAAVNHGNQINEVGKDIIEFVCNGFSQATEAIGYAIDEFMPLLVEGFLSYHEALFNTGIEILGWIGRGILNNKDGIQEAASETITNMVTALRDNAPAIIEGGIALLEALVGAIVENLPLIVETGAEIIGQLVAGIATASPAVQAIIGAAVLPHILKIVDVIGDIGGVFNDVVELITGGEGIGKILSVGKTLMAGIQNLFGLIMAHPVVAVVTAVIAAVVLLWTKCEWFRDGVKAVLEAIGGFFVTAYEVITGAFAGAVEFFGGIVDGIKGVFDGIGEFLGGLFTAAWEAVQSVWNAAVEFFAGIGDGINAVFEAVTGFLGDAFSAAWNAITAVWDAAVSFFGGIWDNIKTAAGTAADNIGSALKGAWDAITSVWDGAVSFFGGIVESIIGVFSGIGGKFLEIGGNIVSGLMDGISNAWSSFIGWLGDKVGGIVDAVKSMLGIHSPSTVFAGIGENMALGLGEGWDDEYSDIKRKITNGLSFDAGTVGITANGSYNASGMAQNGAQAGFGGAGNTYVTINSPVAVDAVTAAREWKKTTQRMAMGYV